MSNELTHDQVYDDDSVRMFVWATLIWGIVGMTVGAFAALELAFGLQTGEKYLMVDFWPYSSNSHRCSNFCICW